MRHVVQLSWGDGESEPALACLLSLVVIAATEGPPLNSCDWTLGSNGREWKSTSAKKCSREMTVILASLSGLSAAVVGTREEMLISHYCRGGSCAVRR